MCQNFKMHCTNIQGVERGRGNTVAKKQRSHIKQLSRQQKWQHNAFQLQQHFQAFLYPEHILHIDKDF